MNRKPKVIRLEILQPSYEPEYKIIEGVKCRHATNFSIDDISVYANAVRTYAGPGVAHILPDAYDVIGRKIEGRRALFISDVNTWYSHFKQYENQLSIVKALK